MEENAYIAEILSGLGLAINEKKCSEIIVNYPIIFDKKNTKFSISTSYKISMQPIGTFLADFLNTDFGNYKTFLSFFMKYSLSLLDYGKLQRTFKDGYCSRDCFEDFVLNLLSKNKVEYLKLQQQVDMILDYCLLNPNNKAKDFKPIERLYVLRRISPTLNILNQNKAAYYSVNLFSSFPGKTEKEIYDFLSKKKSEVTELDLILPCGVSAILYKSICSILKEKVYLKVCKNCNQYFIATIKSYNYCENIAPGEKTKTCRNIGRRNAFNASKNSDPLIANYYSLYNRKSMMKSRNPDIEKYIDDFDKFKRTGKIKLDKYKNGQLSSEDFRIWLQKNS